MRYLFCFLLFTCKLLALDVSPDIVPIHRSIDIAKDLGSIEEAVQHPEAFTTVKYFRRFIRKKKDNHNLWLKLSLHNSKETALLRQLVMRWDRANVGLFLVDEEKIIYDDTLNKGDYHSASKIMRLPAHKKMDLYLHVKVPKPIDDFYYFYIVSPEEAKDLVIHKEKYYHNGFFLGILLTMLLYNFFMFFSLKEKSYLYLAFYQFSIVFYISDLRLGTIYLLESYPEFSYWLLKMGSSFFITILSILFTKEFLNTKRDMPTFDRVLNVAVVILAVFQLNGTIINYAAFVYCVYIVVGLYAFWKGNKAAIFYTIGFSGFVCFVILYNLVKLFEWDIYMEYQSAIQVFACIEALSLSMAMYLKIKSIVEEKEKAKAEAIQQEKIMLEQSRFATMGEMLASIAHQWRQPLNHLNLVLNNLRFAKENDKLDDGYLEKKTKEAEQQLKYMSETIEDFSNFFATKGKEEQFRLKEVCDYAVELVESRLKKQKIFLDIQCQDDCTHVNYKNELVQVLTIVLNNAIDALMLNHIEDRQITICVQCSQIIVEDNAGGIPEEILPKIFDPYFSTKDKKFGTGMGLYMAKMIMRDIVQGQITATNSPKGAMFIVNLESPQS